MTGCRALQNASARKTWYLPISGSSRSGDPMTRARKGVLATRRAPGPSWPQFDLSQLREVTHGHIDCLTRDVGRACDVSPRLTEHLAPNEPLSGPVEVEVDPCSLLRQRLQEIQTVAVVRRGALHKRLLRLGSRVSRRQCRVPGKVSGSQPERLNHTKGMHHWKPLQGCQDLL